MKEPQCGDVWTIEALEEKMFALHCHQAYTILAKEYMYEVRCVDVYHLVMEMEDFFGIIVSMTLARKGI